MVGHKPRGNTAGIDLDDAGSTRGWKCIGLQFYLCLLCFSPIYRTRIVSRPISQQYAIPTSLTKMCDITVLFTRMCFKIFFTVQACLNGT
jgi:hypothetical protein